MLTKPAGPRAYALTFVLLALPFDGAAQRLVVTNQQIEKLTEVTAEDRALLPKPAWDVLADHPDHKTTKPICINFLDMAGWLRPKFATAPSLHRSYWRVSRNFASAEFDGHSDVQLVSLTQDDYKHLRERLSLSIRRIDQYPGTLVAVADKFVEPAAALIGGSVIGSMIGGTVAVLGFTVTGAAAGALVATVGYGAYALYRDYTVSENQESQRGQIMRFNERIGATGNAFRSLVRIGHNGRHYVRERYGFISEQGETRVSTCYWPRTGSGAPRAPGVFVRPVLP